MTDNGILPYDYINQGVSKNNVYITTKFDKDICLIKEIFNLQYLLLQEYTRVLHVDPYAEEDSYTILLGSALFKNMFSLYSALDLTINGLIGSARIILRHIFEFLIIGKFASVSNDVEFIAKWENGEDISLRNNVFKRLLYPNSQEVKDFWKVLCQYAHSTIYSQQLDLDITKNQREVMLNFLYINMLLEMNYHVINSHFLNRSIKYYTTQAHKYYFDDTGEESIVEINKRKLKELFKQSKKLMNKEPRKIIYDFKLKWKLKD